MKPVLDQRAPTRNEVVAALDANRQAGFDLSARTPAHRMLATAVNQLLQRWLDGDPIDPDEVRALEEHVLVAGRWCEETDGGIDHWADIRAERVALLRRIREHAESHTTRARFRPGETPEIAPKKVDESTVAVLALGSRGFPANSGAKTSPKRRRRQAGAIQGGSAARRFPLGMSATQETETARRELRERKTFALRLRLTRDERKWNQDQLGEFLKVRREEINRAECAHTWGRMPSQQTRIKWAVALDKPRDWFVPEVEIDERLEELTAEEQASL